MRSAAKKTVFVLLLLLCAVFTFFIYTACFLMQTGGMERGSDLYMKLMYPGIIPLISLADPIFRKGSLTKKADPKGDLKKCQKTVHG